MVDVDASIGVGRVGGGNEFTDASVCFLQMDAIVHPINISDSNEVCVCWCFALTVKGAIEDMGEVKLLGYE